MATPAYPQHDSYTDPPVDLVAIPLGAGQEPNAYGGTGSFLWDTSADAGTTVDPLSVSRDGKPIRIISRVPERP